MRSGSTLLRYLLDSHERIACPPESKFISALHAIYAYPQAMDGLQSLGVSEPFLDDCMAALIESIMGRYAAASGKSRWVDKTPAYYTLLPFLDRLFQNRCQYIFLVRHPLDCVHSLEQFRLRFPGMIDEDRDAARFIDSYGATRLAWARYWLDVYKTAHEYRTANPARSCVVRYEDLVLTTAHSMSRIVNFLGEDPALLHIDRALAQTDGHGYQDDKIRHTTEVHRNRIGCSSEWPAEQLALLWEQTREVALRFGYTADPECYNRSPDG